MQILKAETCVRRKNGRPFESVTDEVECVPKRRMFFWGLRPQAPGILSRLMPIPAGVFFQILLLGSSLL